jgi:Ser/Thr protein kinase RdoA (MazF antagonist)
MAEKDVVMEFTHYSILEDYAFSNPKIIFLRHNENLVYQVIDNNKTYLLRIHKPIDGFSLNLHQRQYTMSDYIDGEMHLLDYIRHHSDIHVQVPIKNKDNHFVSFLDDGTPVTLLTWIEGETIKADACDESLVYQVGQMVGKLHQCMAPLKTIKRYAYDQKLIKKMKKEIDVAYQKKHLTNQDKDLVLHSLDYVKNIMDRLDTEKEEKVLVHYDHSLSNIISHQNTLSPIDFSLSGYGYYQMDLSALVVSFQEEKLRKAAIKGFEDITHKHVDISVVETFLAFSVLLYISFQHAKVYQESWFQKGMDRWGNQIFKPMLDGKSFFI